MLGTFRNAIKAFQPSPFIFNVHSRSLLPSSLLRRAASTSSSSDSDSSEDDRRRSKGLLKGRDQGRGTGAKSVAAADDDSDSFEEELDDEEMRAILEKAERIKKMQNARKAAGKTVGDNRGPNAGANKGTNAGDNRSSNAGANKGTNPGANKDTKVSAAPPKSPAASTGSAAPPQLPPANEVEMAVEDFEFKAKRKLLLEMIDEEKNPREKERLTQFLADINRKRYAGRKAREELSDMYHYFRSLNNEPQEEESESDDDEAKRNKDLASKRKMSLREAYEATFTDDLSFWENEFTPLLQQMADPGVYSEIEAKALNGGLNLSGARTKPKPGDLRVNNVQFPANNEPPKHWIQHFKRTEGHYMMSKRMAVNHIPNVRLPQVGTDWPDDIVDHRDDVRHSPLGHCVADVGKFYEPCYKKLTGLLPEGFAHTLEHEFEFTGTTRLQIRPQGLEIIDTLRSLKKGLPVQDAIILDGETGTGKSCVLQHAVHFARESEMLTLWIPNSKKIMFESLEWYPSLVYEGMWEQPGLAIELLKNFVKVHGNMLMHLPRRGKYGAKYTGNPYDKELRKSLKEREEFVLGKMAESEEKRWGNKNLVPEITLDDVLKELDATAARYEYEMKNAEALKKAAKENGSTYVPPPSNFNLAAAKKKAAEDFQAQKDAEARAKALEEKAEQESLSIMDKEDKEKQDLEDRLAAKLHRDWAPKGKEGTLLHMIEWGLAAPAQSVQLVAHLREELAHVTEVPVVIAIDGINWLYHISDYYDGPEVRLTADKLVLPSAFHELTPEGVREGPLKLKRGIILASTDYNKQHMCYRYKISRGDKRTQKVDPFKMTPKLAALSIQMGQYNDWETEAAVMNYFDREKLHFKPNKAVIQQVRMMADANPRKVRLYVEDGMIMWERPFHTF